MTRPLIRKRPFHFKNTCPSDPNLTPFAEWRPENRVFYREFREWLKNGGYSEHVIATYSVPVRLALSLLDKPYTEINPVTDLEQVRAYLCSHCCPATCLTYHKGLAKLAHYLRLRGGLPASSPAIHWDYYLASLPDWLADTLRAYLAHCQRTWPPEQRYRAARDLLSHLTLFLRWAAVHATINSSRDLTSTLWFDYVDTRLLAGIQPVTLNGELLHLQKLARFLEAQGQPLDPGLRQLKPLPGRERLPRDMPNSQLCQIQTVIEAEAGRLGRMDKAWFLLMWHSGLRTGEVRRLRLDDLDLAARRVRIEQGKGRKDRLVCLSRPTIAALEVYLALERITDSDYVFTYRHRSLSSSYCGQRLRTYGRRCGLRITPHQLRHNFATMLLNAGAPVVTVQALLGHKHLDTTLNYARLYDGTIAADYERAMGKIMRREGVQAEAILPTRRLLTLVDSLGASRLDEVQRETVQALRAAVLALAG